MTIRIAAAHSSGNPVITRHFWRPDCLHAANDNTDGVSGEALLRTTLVHFAKHGLGAAEHARKLAEQAFFAGDRLEYRKWLAVCRSLDRRMARSVAFHGRASQLEL